MEYRYDAARLGVDGLYPVGFITAVEASLIVGVCTAVVIDAVPIPDEVVVTMSVALTTEDELTLQAIVDSHDGSMASHRKRRYNEIDLRTRAIIALGVEYPAASGTFFSMSKEAQSKYHATSIGVDAGIMDYPIRYDAKDDSSRISFADAIEFNAFYAAALTSARAALGGGSDLKDTIRQAVDHAAIDAVVDNR